MRAISNRIFLNTFKRTHANLQHPTAYSQTYTLSLINTSSHIYIHTSNTEIYFVHHPLPSTQTIMHPSDQTDRTRNYCSPFLRLRFAVLSLSLLLSLARGRPERIGARPMSARHARVIRASLLSVKQFAVTKTFLLEQI